MRSFTPTTAAAFASRAPLRAHVLIWISARDRSTGSLQTMGLWTGDDHAEFVISGQTRTYFGAGSLIGVDPLKFGTGLQVRTQRLRLAGVTPENALWIRGYDPRHAPVEMHRVLFDPETDLAIDAPHLVLKGYIDKIMLPTPKKGEAGSIEVQIATAARALTKPLSLKRSNASLRGRSPDDAFRKYAVLADKVETSWGR